MKIPTLTTSRLVLKPFAIEDGPTVEKLAGDVEVSQTTMNIPHPYPQGGGELWIAGHQLAFTEGRGLTLSIWRDDQLVGAIGLMIQCEQRMAELGYWIGRPFWGNGYCTEAAREVLRYGFEVLALDRIFARHMATNPASGAVMRKVGMQPEGVLRRHLLKHDQRVDTVMYGILREEFKP